MKKIKRVGRVNPRGQIKFFESRPDLYERLNDGETIEVPDEVFLQLRNVVETNDTIVSNFKTHSKSSDKKKKVSSDVYNQAQTDARNAEVLINRKKLENQEHGVTLVEEIRKFQTDSKES